MALLDEGEFVKISPSGEILQSDPETIERELIFLVETPLGGVEILKPSEFQKRAEAAKSLQPPPLAVAPFDEAQAKQHQKEWADYLGVRLPCGDYDVLALRGQRHDAARICVDQREFGSQGTPGGAVETERLGAVRHARQRV